MALIEDRPVQGRVTHAFVVGVSRYAHLEDGAQPTPAGLASGLKQLSSAARSASDFAAWLMDEYHRPDAPLQSLNLCVAPGPGEAIDPRMTARLSGPPDATRDSVLKAWVDFRDRCLASPDAVAFVYVAGHGVQLTKRGAILLLEDFAAPGQPNQLYAALDMVGLHDSLDAAAAAQEQFWFVDACRQPPKIARKFEKLKEAFGDDERPGRCAFSPLLLASSPKDVAWANRNGGSLFSEALLSGLRVFGADGPKRRGERWSVTLGKLAAHVIREVQTRARRSNREQWADLGGRPGSTDQVVTFLKAPPSSRLKLHLQPDEAIGCSSAALYFEGKPVPIDPGWPVQKVVSAGLYAVTVATAPPFLTGQHAIQVDPPEYETTLEVGR